MINVNHLTLSYGPSRGVTDISFDIPSGQIVGLLGPNGAGKSTTIKTLTTHLHPTSGTVFIDGLDVTTSALGIRKFLGYLPETAPSYADMILADYLEFVASIHQLTGSQAQKAIKKVAGDCSLQDVLMRPIDELSRGFRQRVGLAAAIIHQPKLIILDEPTSGLDPNQVSDIHKLIRRLSHQATILFSSHILSDVEELCERVIILNEGQLVADTQVTDNLKDLFTRLTGGAS